MSDRIARWLALAIPALLLAGAFISEHHFGLEPCQMCWWQRYPHFAAVPLALLAFVLPPARLWTALAGLAVAVSGAIGAYHAGVEYHLWPSPLPCTGIDALALDFVRCDQAAWTLWGVSLAGFNALFSLGGACAIWVLLLAKEKPQAGDPA